MLHLVLVGTDKSVLLALEQILARAFIYSYTCRLRLPIESDDFFFFALLLLVVDSALVVKSDYSYRQATTVALNFYLSVYI